MAYFTDSVKWTCAWNAFLSRFLLCTYIKNCSGEISDRLIYLSEILRYRQSPFWVHEHLVLCHGRKVLFTKVCIEFKNNPCSAYETGNKSLIIEEAEELNNNKEMSQRQNGSIAIKTSCRDIEAKRINRQCEIPWSVVPRTKIDRSRQNCSWRNSAS